MRVGIATDQAEFLLKEELLSQLQADGHPREPLHKLIDLYTLSAADRQMRRWGDG